MKLKKYYSYNLDLYTYNKIIHSLYVIEHNEIIITIKRLDYLRSYYRIKS